MYTLKKIRKDLKDMGYKIKTQRTSEFIAATVYDAENNPINRGVLPREIAEKNKAFFDYKESIRGNAYEDENCHMRVVL